MKIKYISYSIYFLIFSWFPSSNGYLGELEEHEKKMYMSDYSSIIYFGVYEFFLYLARACYTKDAIYGISPLFVSTRLSVVLLHLVFSTFGYHTATYLHRWYNNQVFFPMHYQGDDSPFLWSKSKYPEDFVSSHKETCKSVPFHSLVKKFVDCESISDFAIEYSDLIKDNGCHHNMFQCIGISPERSFDYYRSCLINRLNSYLIGNFYLTLNCGINLRMFTSIFLRNLYTAFDIDFRLSPEGKLTTTAGADFSKSINTFHIVPGSKFQKLKWFLLPILAFYLAGFKTEDTSVIAWRVFIPTTMCMKLYSYSRYRVSETNPNLWVPKKEGSLSPLAYNRFNGFLISFFTMLYDDKVDKRAFLTLPGAMTFPLAPDCNSPNETSSDSGYTSSSPDSDDESETSFKITGYTPKFVRCSSSNHCMSKTLEDLIEESKKNFKLFASADCDNIFAQSVLPYTSDQDRKCLQGLSSSTPKGAPSLIGNLTACIVNFRRFSLPMHNIHDVFFVGCGSGTYPKTFQYMFGVPSERIHYITKKTGGSTRATWCPPGSIDLSDNYSGGDFTKPLNITRNPLHGTKNNSLYIFESWEISATNSEKVKRNLTNLKEFFNIAKRNPASFLVFKLEMLNPVYLSIIFDNYDIVPHHFRLSFFRDRRVHSPSFCLILTPSRFHDTVKKSSEYFANVCDREFKTCVEYQNA